MKQLLDLAIEDSEEVTALRREEPVALGLALAEAGCSVEAAPLLRPTRKAWVDAPRAEVGRRALETMTWWNKTWRSFAQAMHGERYDTALSILGTRHLMLWDQPAVLLHVSRLARHRSEQTLVRHVLIRLRYLCDRGLPKTDITAFRYAGEAQMIDILCDEGSFEDALRAHRALTPNQGNVMAHQIQGAELLARTGRHDAAMRAVGELLVTASSRKTWGAEIRREFVDQSEALAPLRKRKDWAALLSDPKAYLQATKT